jgi:hypothetical protein
MQGHKVAGELLTRQEFDELFYEDAFIIGPFRDSFGDDDGEPYIPERQAFGQLKDGRYVYAELTEDDL